MKKTIKLRDLTKEQWDKNRNSLCKLDKGENCDKCIFQWIGQDPEYRYSWLNNEDMFSKEFLDQEVEIEVPDILTKEEKEYLANVIKPFKDKVTSISKKQAANLINLGLGGAVCRLGCYINIQVKDDFFASGFYQNIELVRFEENTMYQGMEIDKQYTLEELGLN